MDHRRRDMRDEDDMLLAIALENSMRGNDEISFTNEMVEEKVHLVHKKALRRIPDPFDDDEGRREDEQKMEVEEKEEKETVTKSKKKL